MKIIRNNNSKSKGDYELYKVTKEGKDAYVICPLGFNLYLGSQRIFRGTKDECQKMLDDLI